MLTRVRRIKGQAEGLERALNAETECLAILQQIAAIRGAVNGLMAEVLEGHIRTHLGAHDISEHSGTTIWKRWWPRCVPT